MLSSIHQKSQTNYCFFQKGLWLVAATACQSRFHRCQPADHNTCASAQCIHAHLLRGTVALWCPHYQLTRDFIAVPDGSTHLDRVLAGITLAALSMAVTLASNLVMQMLKISMTQLACIKAARSGIAGMLSLESKLHVHRQLLNTAAQEPHAWSAAELQSMCMYGGRSPPNARRHLVETSSIGPYTP